MDDVDFVPSSQFDPSIINLFGNSLWTKFCVDLCTPRHLYGKIGA